MKSNFKLMLLILSILLLFLNGCSHNFAWYEYPIKPERILTKNEFIENKEIKIIRGISNDSKKMLASIGVHTLYGNEQSLTDGIVDQLTKEIQKLHLKITNTTKKSLKITVNRSIFEPGSYKIASTLEFSVEFGNGKTKSYAVRNGNPCFGRPNSILHRCYNGVIALAVIEIINDPEVVAYINE